MHNPFHTDDKGGCILRFRIWLACLLYCAFFTPGLVLGSSTEPVRLSGAFIQFFVGMELWGADRWHPILDRMREAKIPLVIVQMTAYEQANGTTYSFIPSGSQDAIATIIAYANQNNMQVMLGLKVHQLNGNTSSTGAAFLNKATADNIAVARQVWDRYLKNGVPPCFAGWYIPLEPWTGDFSADEVARLRTFYSQVSAECKKLSGPAPVSMSPAISSGRPPARIAGQIYTNLLTGSGIDIVMLQDSVGAQIWDANVMANTDPYFRELRWACDQTKVQFWANVESFRIYGDVFEPCTFDRLQRQLRSEWRYADRMITFDFFHYMNPVVFLDSWSPARIAAMTNLYYQYKSNVVDRDFIPEPPVAFQSISGHENSVSLSWNAQKGKMNSLDTTAGIASPIWWEMEGNIAGTGAVKTILDTNATNLSRFYRLKQSPPYAVPENMIWIPPGTFVLGSPDTETGRRTNEGPQTLVAMSQGFWMCRFAVTQAEYQNVCLTNPSINSDDLSLPVDNVTWLQATNYCAQLNDMERQSGRLPHGFAYRLPTEAEWEYAARAGTTTPYYFGSDTNLLEANGWYRQNSDGASHLIGLKAPNAWGLYDMSGNVMEWCLDALNTYPGGSATNYQGPLQGTTRMVRGGAWDRPAVNGRSAWRENHLPNIKYPDLGFRVVLAPIL